MSTVHTALLLITLTTIAIVHWLATTLYLYWSYPLLDVPMHMLGGAAVAFALFAFCAKRARCRALTSVPGVLACVLCVGFVWEVFEYVGGISIMDASFHMDTALDTLMNCLGGFIGYSVARAIEE